MLLRKKCFTLDRMSDGDEQINYISEDFNEMSVNIK